MLVQHLPVVNLIC